MQEVKDYFKEKGYTEAAAIKFYDYYSDEKSPDKPWVDGNGKAIKDWRKKAKSVWFRDEYKIKEEVKQTQSSPGYLF